MPLIAHKSFFASLLCKAVFAGALLADAQAQTSESRGDKIGEIHLAPGNGGARRWQVVSGGPLQIFKAPSVDAAVVTDVPPGTVLSSFGCEKASGEIWCRVRPFRGGKRGFATADRLAPAKGPDGLVATGIDDSDRRAKKRDFDATGSIACAQERGQAMGICKAGVARNTGGDATVAVTFANGFSRRLRFVHGEFLSANATMSGAGRDTDWRLENGIHVIRVDDQRYDIPDGFVFGN